MTEIVIRVDAAGARCLWTDAIDLRDLGPLKVRRVSTVEFDEAAQVWVAVEQATGQVIAWDPSRQAVLEAEAAYFAERL